MMFKRMMTSPLIICTSIILLLLSLLFIVKVYKPYGTFNIYANKRISETITPHAHNHSAHLTPGQVEGVAGGVRTSKEYPRSSLQHLSKNVTSSEAANMTAKTGDTSSKEAIMSPAEKDLVYVTPDQIEGVRRQVSLGIRSTAAFLRSSLRQLAQKVNPAEAAKIKALLAEAEDRLRVVQLDLSNLDRLNDLTAWREREAAALSQEVQQRIHALQNPPDCASAKKIVCGMSRPAGAGSLIHHLVYCIMAAYESGKTFVLQSKGWKYSPKGWEVLFQPLSRNCVHVPSEAIVPWPGSSDSKAVMFPDWNNPDPKPSHQPLAVPSDIASRLQRFHEAPADWWVGQFIAYMMRFQPEMQQNIDQVKEKLKFSHPIVGVQIRRTDKKIEAELYPLEEYMTHVENYYLGLDRADPSAAPVRRRVFLMTELSSLITEAKTKYPHYEFLWHKNTAEKEKNRYNVKGLQDYVTELYFLAHSDYLVCTFSSNVGRLAYEMMQSVRADAPSRVISLDTNYMFHQQWPRHVKVRFPHRPDSSAKEKGFMEADAGQVLTAVTPNVFGTGYTKIFAPGGNNEVKFLPDYKLCEVLNVANVRLA